MADVRPLPGFRYAADDTLAARVAPPYDVISPAQQAAYHERNSENIVRLELGQDAPGDDELENRYTRAATTFARWRLDGVLQQDPAALYLYEQRFTVAGREHTRLSLLARVRLEPWEAGVILPHERTLSAPKEDRLRLMRACAANFSPLMALYDDPQNELANRFTTIRASAPVAELMDDAGEGHRLWLMTDPATVAEVTAFLQPRNLYIADGHHRYETALAYRDEVRALRKEQLPDEATNFALMALTAIEDPGLVVFPTHRLVVDQPAEVLAGLREQIGTQFSIKPIVNPTPQTIMAALEALPVETPALALVDAQGASLLRLSTAGEAAMRERASAEGHSEAWQKLDVAALHALVLEEGLGLSAEDVRAGRGVRYTHDATEAVGAVGKTAQAALLMRGMPPAALRDVVRSGDRLPQKSTYFYPKLLTGLVINPLW